MKYAKVKMREYGVEVTRCAVLVETEADIKEAISRYGTSDDEQTIVYLKGHLPFALQLNKNGHYSLRNAWKEVIEVIASEEVGPYFIEIGERDGPGSSISTVSWSRNNPTWESKEGKI